LERSGKRDMPTAKLVKQYKLTETQDKIVNIILDDTILSLRQVLRLEGDVIKKIILHKLIDIT